MSDGIKLVLTALFVSVGLPLLFLGFIIIVFVTSPIEGPELRIGYAFERAFILLIFLFIPLGLALFYIYGSKKQSNEINKKHIGLYSDAISDKPNKKVGLFISPFKDISWYLNKVRPEEKIVNEQKVLILYASDYWINFVIFIKLLPNFLFTAKIIETEKAYYLDKRKQSFLTVGIYTVIILIISEILNSIGSTFGPLMPILIIFYILWLLFILSFPLNQIKVINKDWITEKNDSDNKLLIVGDYPKNVLRNLNPDPFLSSFGRVRNSFRYSFKIKGV